MALPVSLGEEGEGGGGRGRGREGGAYPTSVHLDLHPGVFLTGRRGGRKHDFFLFFSSPPAVLRFSVDLQRIFFKLSNESIWIFTSWSRPGGSATPLGHQLETSVSISISS